jgi:hypothetical protein
MDDAKRASIIATGIVRLPAYRLKLFLQPKQHLLRALADKLSSRLQSVPKAHDRSAI